MSKISQKNFMIALAVIGVAVASLVAIPAFAEDSSGVAFPVAANDTTLGIVVLGGILGVVMRNTLGYRQAKQKAEADAKAKNVECDFSYDKSKLYGTLVFAFPLGTLLGLTSVALLSIDVGTSYVKGFVLLMLTIVSVIGLDKLKADTSS